MPRMSEHEPWLKPYMVAGGALVQLLNEGEFTDPQESKFGKASFNVLVGLPDQSVKTWSMNKQTRDRMAAAWGDDSATWVGHMVRIKVSEQNVSGQMRDVMYGWPVEISAQPVQTPD